ncbi:hypothetical protein [Rhodopseudomonas infernalis]|uniref:hypothetical protein n=1 Tax=Rhodopseudomonas infernalis TaxID=2897386 RepID=UPI001EE93284|nr:hypothetical protein [Rhodopseudomonas infernalis]
MPDACPILIQAASAAPTWWGPFLGGAVGALAAALAAILSFRAMSKATNASLLTNSLLLLEKKESLKREAFSELLAITYNQKTPATVSDAHRTIARLKLLIDPKNKSSSDLLDHLDSIFVRPDFTDWRARLIELAFTELERKNSFNAG